MTEQMRTKGPQKILREFSVEDPDYFGIVFLNPNRRTLTSRTKSHALNLVNLYSWQLVGAGELQTTVLLVQRITRIR